MSLIWVFLAPLLGALYVALRSESRSLPLAAISVAALGPSLFQLLSPLPDLETYPYFLLGASFGLDSTRWVFLRRTALLWALAGLFATASLGPGPRTARYFVFHLLCLCGNLGLLISYDLISFYCFFACMTLAAYGLVIHQQGVQELRAGTVYMAMTILGEVLLIACFFLTVHESGSLALSDLPQSASSSPRSGLIFTLGWLGFGIKAGALPVHFWLPLAHTAAPAPGSAVLSGAMIKAGLFGWMVLFPLGGEAQPFWGLLFLALGLVASFFGILVGLTQSQSKAVLAYSSISQMGLMTVLVGVGWMSPPLWETALQAVLLYAYAHAMAKGALFLGAGLSYRTARDSGRGRLLLTGCGLAALSIAGAPLLAGGVAKKMLKEVGVGAFSDWGVPLATILFFGSVGTTALLLRFLLLTLQKMTSVQKSAKLGAAWAAWGVTIAAVAAGGAPLGRLFTLPNWGLGSALSAAAPVAVGGALFFAWVRIARNWPGLSIPAGDIASLMAIPSQAAYSLLKSPARAPGSLSALLAAPTRIQRRTHAFHRIELFLEEWSVAGTVFVGLLLAFAALMLGGGSP